MVRDLSESGLDDAVLREEAISSWIHDTFEDADFSETGLDDAILMEEAIQAWMNDYLN